MKNVFKLSAMLFVVFAMVCALTSCNSDSTAASDEARQSLQTNPQVKPVTTAANTPVNGQTPTLNAQAQEQKPVEPAKPVGPTTTIEWGEKQFDFGEVEAGEKVGHIYKFKNTGKEPLIISNAKASCGCTVPNWPKEPIPPGESGEIKVEFDSKGKNGPQSKTVTIEANVEGGRDLLVIKGKVKGQPKPATQPQQGQPVQPAAQMQSAVQPVKK